MALSGIVLLEGMFDLHILGLVRFMVLQRTMSHLLLAHSYPDHNSLAIALGFIIIALVYLNVILGVLYLIINCRDLFLVLSYDCPMTYEMHSAKLSNVLIPVILVMFASEPLRYLAVHVIVYVGYTIAIITGIA
jgi:hypothetical protein